MGAEIFCEFRYKELVFSVSEPYGDNSFYDILCDKPDTEALIEIYEKFCTISGSGNAEKWNKKRLMIWAAFIIAAGIIISVIPSS